jgi:1-aminocyclopropane-1-carboxylate deaminase/D-cysteine desulfhydrase-like pyridoxal-dependent ACC family enzyme
MHDVAARLRAEGRNPYVLESSVHPLSVLAFANLALELLAQLDAVGVGDARIYVTSEGSVLAGLLFATRLLGLPWEVVGLDWRPRQSGVVEELLTVISRAASTLALPNPVREQDIAIRDSGGPAYGVGRPESWEALGRAAEREGLLLDPVYTAKGMAGTLADLCSRAERRAETVVFVHTGGVAAMFAYEPELRQFVVRARV